MQDDLLSTTELARRLGIRPQTIRNWVLQGKIPELRLSHKVRRFRWKDVLRALQERAQPPPKVRE
jgi:excisionase family DNA binding protein